MSEDFYFICTKPLSQKANRRLRLRTEHSSKFYWLTKHQNIGVEPAMYVFASYPVFHLTDHAEQMISEVEPLFIGLFSAEAEKAIPSNPETYAKGTALTKNKAYRVAPNQPRS